MSELNDFLKAIAEGKKKTIESSPGKKALKALAESLHDTNPFLSTPSEEPITSTPPSKVEVVGEFILEDGEYKYSADTILTEVVVPDVKPAAEQIPMDQINKYLKQNASFQQPNPDVVDPTVRAIQDKLKFLEQSVGRIAATGPGSGEVNFRYLDDVNRSTMLPSNNNWLLEYDAAAKKVQFTDKLGPIQQIHFDTEHVHDEVRIPGTLCWDPKDRTLNLTHPDDVTQQIGQETFMRVMNMTGSTIPNGSSVRFAGATNGSNEARLLVAPWTANGEYPSLYGVGITTQDIPSGQEGFVTVFGKIRQLNTTGSSVGETWVSGDILYAHPDIAGALTKVKPTAPDNVVPMAAVLKVNATEGEIFVRPTIYPPLRYGTFVDKTDQTQTSINTPKAITFSNTEVANGHKRGVNTSQIIAEYSGLYNYKFSIQLVSGSSSAKDVWIWFRKNGVDIPDSATRKTLTGNGVYDVAAWDISVSMNANDYFQIMWAVSDTGLRIDAPAATAFCPAIPSVILNVTEAAL